MELTKTNHQHGIDAEEICCSFLQGLGYKVLERRYKTTYGEIDIIAANTNLVAFIEVKKRKYTLHDDPITPKQKQRIGNSALQYITKNPEIAEHDMRFDFILVDNQLNITHITDAWRNDE